MRGMAVETASTAHGELVVDTSAVMAVLLNESSRADVLRATSGVDLVAPTSLPVEVGNALSALLKRRRIDATQARRVVADFRTMAWRPVEIDLEAAVDLAASLNISAYDAYMLSTALSRGCPVVTLDGGLADAGRRANVAVIEVT